jgi:hypothetical protein
MSTTIIIDTVTYEFLNRYPSDVSNPPEVWSPNPQIQLTTTDDPNLLMAVYDSNTSNIILAKDPTKVATFTAQQWTNLRTQRDALLQACDWTQLPDSPITSDLKQQWQSYRQQLRNIPENTTDPTNPSWPVPPS